MAKRQIITLKAKPKQPEPVEPPVMELTPTPAPPISKTRLAKAQLRAATAWLEATWPLAFRSPIRPLAIGAGLDILAHPSSDFTADERHAALRAWTCRWDYQRAIVARRVRVNLGGSDAAEVSDAERSHAFGRLKPPPMKRGAPDEKRTPKDDDDDSRPTRNEFPTAS